MKTTINWVAYTKPLVFFLLLLPLVWLGLMAYQNQLGADPAKKLVDETGLWAFRILLLSLLMTPLKNWTGPYIIVDLMACLLLIPLGVTSTRNWQKRLGKNWLRLHKTVYVISLLALLHFSWVKKLGIASIWPYALVLAILLAERLRMAHQRRQYRAAISIDEQH